MKLSNKNKAKTYYPYNVPVPGDGEIIIFRNTADSFRYYKNSNNSSIKLTNNGNGETFLIDQDNVTKIHLLVNETIEVFSSDAGLAIRFIAISDKIPQTIIVPSSGGVNSNSTAYLDENESEFLQVSVNRLLTNN